MVAFAFASREEVLDVVFPALEEGLEGLLEGWGKAGVTCELSDCLKKSAKACACLSFFTSWRYALVRRQFSDSSSEILFRFASCRFYNHAMYSVFVATTASWLSISFFFRWHSNRCSWLDSSSAPSTDCFF